MGHEACLLTTYRQPWCQKEYGHMLAAGVHTCQHVPAFMKFLTATNAPLRLHTFTSQNVNSVRTIALLGTPVPLTQQLTLVAY